MKRIALLIAFTALLLNGAECGAVEAVKELQKADAKVSQQLKDLVKKRRTRDGWLGDGTVPENVRTIKDIAYTENPVSDAQKLDLYIPSILTIEADREPISSKSNFSAKRRNLSGGWPLVVWIHGGGWKGGDKKGGPFRALLESGFAVASINYRLSGESKWPAQFDDCQTALSYLRKHAGEYGIDPKRIGLWGGSAGGHLVLMLGLRQDGTDDKVACVCDWFGPTDLSRFMLMGETTKQGEDLVHDLFGLQGDALMSACASASPVNYINTAKNVPPILIMHGKDDKLVSIRQSRSFVERMKKAGYKDVKLDEVNGGHGYPGFGPGTVGDVVKFFKTRLEEKEGA